MKRSGWLRSALIVVVACCAFGQSLPRPSDPQQAQNAELLRKARAAYYSLRAEGMKNFTCAMTPDWTALLQVEGVTDPKALGPAVQKLNQLRFTVSVDGDGAAKVAHNEIPAENQKVAEGFKQIYGGMEQMTTGFFQTWSVFVVSPPLPEPGTPIKLVSDSKRYMIDYMEGTTKVSMSIGKDYSANSVRAVTADSDTLINPSFASTEKGFLMTGYHATYEGTGGKDKTILDVGIEYQEVSGLKVPQKVALRGSYNDRPFQVEIEFSACIVSK